MNLVPLIFRRFWWAICRRLAKRKTHEKALKPRSHWTKVGETRGIKHPLD